jgi:folate-binding protein YgfZ
MSPWIGLKRTLLVVSGPDARPFLQNILTQDMDRLENEQVVYSALLNPQGKVVTDLFVWRWHDGGVLLDVPSERAATLLTRLNMYKLRSQVSIAEFDDRLGVVASLDPGVIHDPRRPKGGFGVRHLFERETMPDLNDALYEQWRINFGVPDLARDAAPEEVFAGEALLEELNGVAFDKGCFVGQENVSRMKRRATTRKKFCPVVFEGEAIAFGTPVLAGEAEIGSVRTGVAGRAIALLRLDRTLDAVAVGKALTAAGREIRLDPPAWLILPQREDTAE